MCRKDTAKWCFVYTPVLVAHLANVRHHCMTNETRALGYCNVNDNDSVLKNNEKNQDGHRKNRPLRCEI